MAHEYQRAFIRSVRQVYPDMFVDKRVLDCGSLDINGNNRWAFENCAYEGVDIVEGKNVDTVSRVHELGRTYDERFDVVISTEMLEHDEFWQDSIIRMYQMLKPGGLLILTAGGTGRVEHGTHARNPEASPGTNDFYENMNLVKMNRVINEIRKLINQSRAINNLEPFEGVKINDIFQDFQFYGIKASY